MKRIVVAGFYRTGSTWLFNAVKTVIKQGGRSTSQTGDLPLVTADSDYMIHKIHGFSDELRDNADFIFVSTRDRQESLESFERCFGHPIDPNADKAARKANANWLGTKGVVVVTFSNIQKNKATVLNLIAYKLGLKINLHETLRELESIKPPEYGQDQESLYFSRHITSNETDHSNTRS